jgi:hypothetical protein
MSAELLRQAATILRERAEDANPGPWSADRNAVRTGRDALALTYDIHFGNDHDQTRKDAAYIATMHPGVGLALADWLDAEFAHDFGPGEHAIELARLIVGDA